MFKLENMESIGHYSSCSATLCFWFKLLMMLEFLRLFWILVLLYLLRSILLFVGLKILLWFYGDFVYWLFYSLYGWIEIKQFWSGSWAGVELFVETKCWFCLFVGFGLIWGYFFFSLFIEMGMLFRFETFYLRLVFLFVQFGMFWGGLIIHSLCN